MIPFLLVTVTAFAAVMVVYFAAKRIERTWGTLAANAATAATFIGLLIDTANTLPWDNVVGTETSLSIGFALALANGLIRMIGVKPAVKMPFAGKLK